MCTLERQLRDTRETVVVERIDVVKIKKGASAEEVMSCAAWR